MAYEITLQNADKGILVNLDIRNGFKSRLLNHLQLIHPEVMEEMEFRKGGTIKFTGEEIQIKGDNGILFLDLIDIPNC